MSVFKAAVALIWAVLINFIAFGGNCQALGVHAHGNFTAEHQAEFGAPSLSESIVVFYLPINIKQRGPAGYSGHISLGEWVGNIVGQCYSVVREKDSVPFKRLVRQVVGGLRGIDYTIGPIGNISGWGLAKILDDDPPMRFLTNSDIRKSVIFDANVSSQLTLFRILSGFRQSMAISNLRPIGFELAQRGNDQRNSGESVEDQSASDHALSSKSPFVAIGIVLIVLVIVGTKGYEAIVYRGKLIAGMGILAAVLCAWVAAIWWFIVWFSGHSILPGDISEAASASRGSYCVSAPPYGRAENVGIAPIVIPKFELRNVQGQIFSADFVEGSDNATFDERPKAAKFAYEPRRQRAARDCGQRPRLGNDA